MTDYYGLGKPEGWWESRVNKVDGIEVYWDPITRGTASIRDIAHPAMMFEDGSFVATPRSYRIYPPETLHEPTEALLRKGIKQYTAEHGKPPEFIRITVLPDRKYGIVLIGETYAKDYTWPACEWCGSTTLHSRECRPTKTEEINGSTFLTVTLTMAERAFLAQLPLDRDRPEVRSLRHKLLLPESDEEMDPLWLYA